MAVYAIGDVQGCYDALTRLLDRIHFDSTSDQLWFVGDLVNRGPQSIETLRFVKNLGDSAITVLGNHDLHLLAVATEHHSPRSGDTLDSILSAPDREEFIDWLRHRPLAHHNARLDWTMVHAGVAPGWSIEETLTLAAEVEIRLAAPDWADFLANMYGNEPACWNPDLKGTDRLRAIINYLTRTRFCAPDGSLDFAHKGPPGSQPAPLVPWFALPQRQSARDRIVFGHWSALGMSDTHNAFAIDTGCIWGGRLTALRLDGETRHTSVDNAKARTDRNQPDETS